MLPFQSPTWQWDIYLSKSLTQSAQTHGRGKTASRLCPFRYLTLWNWFPFKILFIHDLFPFLFHTLIRDILLSLGLLLPVRILPNMDALATPISIYKHRLPYVNPPPRRIFVSMPSAHALSFGNRLTRCASVLYWLYFVKLKIERLLCYTLLSECRFI